MKKHFELWPKEEKLQGEFSASVCHTATFKVGLHAGRRLLTGELAPALKAAIEPHTTLSKWVQRPPSAESWRSLDRRPLEVRVHPKVSSCPSWTASLPILNLCNNLSLSTCNNTTSVHVYVCVLLIIHESWSSEDKRFKELAPCFNWRRQLKSIATVDFVYRLLLQVTTGVTEPESLSDQL